MLITMRKAQGFTLLEIMLVMLLMGMISVGVVMTLPSSGITAQGSQWHAQRFSTLLQLTQDQALILNTEFGIQFNEQGYTFASYDVNKRQWLPLVNSRIEADVILPDTVIAEYNLAGSVWGELEAAQSAVNDDSFIDESYTVDLGEEQESTIQPSVYVMSSGEVTPFSYQFSNIGDEEHTVTVKVAMTGLIEILSE